MPKWDSLMQISWRGVKISWHYYFNGGWTYLYSWLWMGIGSPDSLLGGGCWPLLIRFWTYLYSWLWMGRVPWLSPGWRPASSYPPSRCRGRSECDPPPPSLCGAPAFTYIYRHYSAEITKWRHRGTSQMTSLCTSKLSGWREGDHDIIIRNSAIVTYLLWF